MRQEYRIYGPPGTGKTTWIAARIREYAEMFGPDQVSVCSLTRAAVREVLGRDLPVPEDNVSTLHARCKRALQAGSPAESLVAEFAKAHPQYATADCLPVAMLRKTAKDGVTSDEVLLSGGGISLYEHAQILRQKRIPESEWQPGILSWYSMWRSWCKSRGTMDFTGWLEACLDPGILPPQQVVLVDEAQDHTPLQLEVLRAWNVQHMFLVGDDDQNLYEWSGSDPMAFLSPDLPVERELVLNQSYRVPRSVHALATKWVRSISGRRVKEYRPRDHEGEIVMSDYSLSDTKSTGMLPDYIGSGSRTSMVLASCGYMFHDIIPEIKKAGIPFHNPYRPLDAMWNPLDKPFRIFRDYMIGDENWTGSQVASWMGILSDKGACERGGKKRILEACAEAGDNLLPGGTLRNNLNGEAYEMAVTQDSEIFRSMRMTGATGNWDYGLRVLNQYGIDMKPTTILGTIHSVKGGEADDVILFPDLSPAGYAEYDSRVSRDRIVRLFYVGMTRTRDRLMLCDRSSPRAVNWN